MTVVQDNVHFSPCSAPPEEQVDEHTIVTVADKSTEETLLDKDANTYLEAFDHRHRFLRLNSYIYVPQFVSSLRIIVEISGLTCTDQRLLVYRHMLRDCCSDELYEQCPYATSNEITSDIMACEFVCYLKMSIESLANVGIRFENIAQRPMHSVQVRGFRALKFW